MAHEKEHGRVHDPASSARLATALTTLVTLEVGAITFIFGLLRLGFLDAVLSRPLLRGFVSAVGLVILVEQVFPVLGLSEAQASLDLETENTITKAIWVIRNLSSTHALTASVSLCSLLVLLGARLGKPYLPESLRLIRFVPEILVVTVVSTGAHAFSRSSTPLDGRP